MSTQEQYRQDHKIAKTIVFFMVVILLVIGRRLNSVELDILAVFIWFFGVNPIGYLIETLRGHNHNHDKL